SVMGVSPVWDLTASVAGWWIWARSSTPERAAIVGQKDVAREKWRQVEKRWRAESGDGQFARKRAEIENARRVYLDLPARRQRERQRLDTQKQERQLSRYLRGYQISAATLKGIGPGREATLASWGIETAYDVTYSALMAVPGFGPELTQQIVNWRRRIERGFTFDPTQEIDPSDLEFLDRELDREQDRVEQILRGGASDLRRLSDQAVRQRKALEPLIDDARRALAQAEADAAAV
ncbi:MAG TPA: hypothetical protein VKT80_10305, partial [Chloroflexota bacterium]|nr:hypothetical protein [Chloroflexota bacterium]